MKKKNNYPLVSIIIANWNGGEIFRDCLKSLSQIGYPNWELIVVDNGSTDGSDQFPQEKQYRISDLKTLKNKKNLGFVKANNQGYQQSQGKYLLLLNNDTKVTPDFLNKMVNYLEENNHVGVLQPKIYLMGQKGYLDNAGSFLTRIGFLEHWGFGQKDGPEFNQNQEIFSAKGACMLIRRRVVEEVGLFDSDFVSYFEESDFCWRVWLAGYQVIFYPQTQIYHRVGFTIRRLDVLEINFNYYKNRIRSLIKNLGLFNLIMILPLHLLVSLGIAFIFLIRGQAKNSVMILKAIVWNILNLFQTLRKRHFIQKNRKISDRELFSRLLRPIKWKKFFSDFKRIEEDLKRKSKSG